MIPLILQAIPMINFNSPFASGSLTLNILWFVLKVFPSLENAMVQKRQHSQRKLEVLFRNELTKFYVTIFQPPYYMFLLIIGILRTK